LEKQVNNIEEALYDLIGQIDSGDISNLDTFWGSLRDSLLTLNFPEWTKILKSKTQKKLLQLHEVSDVLSAINKARADLLDVALITKTVEMEELSIGRSDESIDEDDLDTLQTLAVDFETLFTAFLDKTVEQYGEKD